MMRVSFMALSAFALIGAPCVGDETIMPTGAVTNGGASWAVSDNYAMQFSVGQPCVGSGMGTNAGADAGFWNILWVASAPAGAIDPGWNWIGVPSHPQFPAISVVLDENPLNRMYKWDWLQKMFLLYPGDFSTLENTVGYLLFSSTNQQSRYSGFLNRTPVDDPGAADYRSTTVYIPAAGAITLGHPHPWPVPLRDLKVRYGAEVRTAPQDRANPNPWVNWNWVYWNSAADVYEICALAGGDDDTLRPWHHYRIWFYVPPGPLDPNGPFLIIPEPEVDLGG
jgi:hypothetical protein